MISKSMKTFNYGYSILIVTKYLNLKKKGPILSALYVFTWITSMNIIIFIL